MQRYLAREGLGLWGRLRIALGRIGESEDDELAFAYHAANEPELPYDRARASRAYARRAYALMRPHHVDHGVALIFKAVGLKRNGWLNRIAARLAWWGIACRAARLQRAS